MMWWYGDWTWGAWLVMSLSMVVFWGLVVYAVAMATRSVATGGRKRTAEEILAERLASGEIDEQEYRSRLGTLHRTHA